MTFYRSLANTSLKFINVYYKIGFLILLFAITLLLIITK